MSAFSLIAASPGRSANSKRSSGRLYSSLPTTRTGCREAALRRAQYHLLRGGGQGLRLLGTHDDEPQHDGELAEHYRENPIGDPLLVLRPQYAGDTRSQIGEAVEHQPDAEDARKEPRPVHQQ